MEDKFHAVIDTNVIVSAVISKNLEATINGWTNLNNEVEIGSPAKFRGIM